MQRTAARVALCGALAIALASCDRKVSALTSGCQANTKNTAAACKGFATMASQSLDDEKFDILLTGMSGKKVEMESKLQRAGALKAVMIAADLKLLELRAIAECGIAGL